MRQLIKSLLVIGWLVSLITLLLITSCQKNIVKDTLKSPEGISGTWILEQITIMNCNEYQDENYMFSCSSQDCIKVQLKDSGTFIVYDITNNITNTYRGTYSVIGDSIEICPEDDDCSNARFEVFPSNSQTLLIQETDPETGCITTFYFIGG